MIVKHVRECNYHHFEKNVQHALNKVLNESNLSRKLIDIKYSTTIDGDFETYYSALLIFD
jgi:hypothetical protein